MAKLMTINKSLDQGIKALLGYLLEHNRVRGVITLKRIGAHKGIGYFLITRPEELEQALPMFPIMPTNGGKLLSQITLSKSLSEPLAVVLRPCELRAFVELVKRGQGSLENFVFISQTCPGVYPLDMSVNGNLETQLPQYWKSTQNCEIAAQIRPACQICLHFIPGLADLTVSLIGRKDLETKCNIILNSEKGERLTSGMEGEVSEAILETEEIKTLKDSRQRKRNEVFEEINRNMQGLEGIIKYLGRCIGCHGCSNVCPICYCDLCFFDSKKNESLPSSFETELEQRGGLRLPGGTVFYHLGRLVHMSISCTGCGMCTDVCPVNIPVSTIFSNIGQFVQQAFDYTPGMDVEQPVPLTTFQEEEFVEIGQ